MHRNLSVVVHAGKILRQSRDCLQWLKRSGLQVGGERDYRRLHFGDDVRELSGRMQHEVTRARTRVELEEWRIVRTERPIRTIELVQVDASKSEIIDKGKAVVGREIDRVRMRALLPVRIRPVPAVLN